MVLMLRQLAQLDLGLSQVSRKTRFLGILLHAARDIPVATLQVSIFHPVHRILPDRQSLIMENRRTVSGVTHIPILAEIIIVSRPDALHLASVRCCSERVT